MRISFSCSFASVVLSPVSTPRVPVSRRAAPFLLSMRVCLSFASLSKHLKAHLASTCFLPRVLKPTRARVEKESLIVGEKNDIGLVAAMARGHEHAHRHARTRSIRSHSPRTPLWWRTRARQYMLGFLEIYGLCAFLPEKYGGSEWLFWLLPY